MTYVMVLWYAGHLSRPAWVPWVWYTVKDAGAGRRCMGHCALPPKAVLDLRPKPSIDFFGGAGCDCPFLLQQCHTVCPCTHSGP